jgi:hypothetical protein
MLKVLTTLPGPRWELFLGLTADDMTEIAGGGELVIDPSTFPVGADASKITVRIGYGRTEQAILDARVAKADPAAVAAFMTD